MQMRRLLLSRAFTVTAGLTLAVLVGLVFMGVVPYRRYLILAGFAAVVGSVFLLHPRYLVWVFLFALPFHSFLPVGTHQMALTAAVAGVFLLRYLMADEEGPRGGLELTTTDWVVFLFMVLNAVALIHGLFRVGGSPERADFIFVLFLKFEAAVAAYFLARVWWTRYGVGPREVNAVLLAAVAVAVGLFFWFVGSQGWNLAAFLGAQEVGTELRAQIFYRDVEHSYTLLQRMALLPGGTNGRALLFVVGAGILLPLFQRAGGGLRKLGLSTFFLVLTAALLVSASRTSWITLAVMVFVLVALGTTSRPRLLLWVTFGAAGLVLLAGWLGAWDFILRMLVSRFETAQAQIFAPRGRVDLNRELLTFLVVGGGFVWGVGFGVVEHLLGTLSFSFNPHNIFTWTLANGGIVLAALQLWVVVKLMMDGAELWRRDDDDASMFGLQAMLVGGAFFLSGMMFLYTKWPPYFTILWIYLGMTVTARHRGWERVEKASEEPEEVEEAALAGTGAPAGVPGVTE